MLTYDEITRFCIENTHALIYLSIGCAQNGNPVSNEQQVPPFVKTWPHPGRILLILVDPALESPPQALKDIHAMEMDEYAPVQQHGHYDIIAIQQNFEWSRDKEKTFIDNLCAITLHPEKHTRLIVQDFSGENIHKHYPLRAFGPALLERVIFDVTHSDGSCHAPWSHGAQPCFQNQQTGGFVHAWNQPLKDIRGHVPDEVYTQQQSRRISELTNYVHRLYHIQAGTHEPRIWCTSDHVQTYAGWLSDIYDVEPGDLMGLLVEGYRDIAVAAGRQPPPVSEVISLIDAPYGEYHKAIRAITNPQPT